MSSGVIHYKYYMMGYRYSIPMSVALVFVDWRVGLGYLVGYTLGRWIDPDWDLMGTSAAEGRIVNELPIVGHLLYGASSSYGSVFRRHHRSWITHWPVVSTVIRLVVAFWLPFTFGDHFGINFIADGWIWFWVSLWMGLSTADGIHWALDVNPRKE